MTKNTPDPDMVVRKIKEEYCTGITKNFLGLISGGEPLILDAVDGTEILVDAKDVFTRIDGDFEHWGANEKEPATGKTPIVVYEMNRDATFVQMFSELGVDRGKLCLTQHQIKNFVKKFPGWLCKDGHMTFFPLKSKDNFFVVGVSSCFDGGLSVYVGHFMSLTVCGATYRPRVVVPQLAV